VERERCNKKVGKKEKREKRRIPGIIKKSSPPSSVTSLAGRYDGFFENI